MQHFPTLSDSPVMIEPVVEWNPNNRVDGGSIPTYHEFLFFLFIKIRVYKSNNKRLIISDRFLFFLAPLLD